jgi:hypothetical protein
MRPVWAAMRIRSALFEHRRTRQEGNWIACLCYPESFTWDE